MFIKFALLNFSVKFNYDFKIILFIYTFFQLQNDYENCFKYPLILPLLSLFVWDLYYSFSTIIIHFMVINIIIK